MVATYNWDDDKPSDSQPSNSPQADQVFVWMIIALAVLGAVVVYSFFW